MVRGPTVRIGVVRPDIERRTQPAGSRCGHGQLIASGRGDYWDGEHGSLEDHTYSARAEENYFESALHLLEAITSGRRSSMLEAGWKSCGTGAGARLGSVYPQNIAHGGLARRRSMSAKPIHAAKPIR
jgi:hypothetical protein